MTEFAPHHTAHSSSAHGRARPGIRRRRITGVLAMVTTLVLIAGGQSGANAVASTPASPAPAPAGEAEKSEAGLMDADRAFAVATAKHRLEGWMGYFTSDAVKFTFKGPLALGKAAVREVDAVTFENPAISLTWEPTDAWLFDDQNTGLTRGDYQVVQTDDAGRKQIVSTGNYLTLWRMEGKVWKIFLDTGVPDQDGNDQTDVHDRKEPGDH